MIGVVCLLMVCALYGACINIVEIMLIIFYMGSLCYVPFRKEGGSGG